MDTADLHQFEEAAVERERLAVLLSARAHQALESGEDGALSHIRQAEKVGATSAKAYYWQAIFWIAFFDKNDSMQGLQLARDKLSVAVSLSPSFSAAWRALGVCLFKLGVALGDLSHFDRANDAFARAEEGERSFALYLDWARMLIYSSRLSGEIYDLKRALEKFTLAAKFGSPSTGYFVEYTSAYLELFGHTKNPRDLDRAKACVHAARGCAQTPGERAAFFLAQATCLARHYAEFGGDEVYLEAHEAYREYFAIQPHDVPAYLNLVTLVLLGAKRRQSGEEAHAALHLVRLIETLAGRTIDSGEMMMKGLILVGKYEDELAPLKEALALGHGLLETYPESHSLALRCAEVQHALGEYFDDISYFRTGLQACRHILELDSQSIQALEWSACCLEEMWIRSGDPSVLSEGLSCLKKAVDIDPLRGDLWHRFGVLVLRRYEDTEDPEDARHAVALLSRAVGLRDEVEWLVDLGVALDLLAGITGDDSLVRDAIKLLEGAISKAPDHVMAKFHLGLCYSHLGSEAGEMEWFDRAHDLFGDIEGALEDEEVLNDEWGCLLLQMAELCDSDYQSREYCLQAEARFRDSARTGRHEALYHLSWLYSYMGHTDHAIGALRAAKDRGVVPGVQELTKEEWLTEIHHTPAFADFLKELARISR